MEFLLKRIVHVKSINRFINVGKSVAYKRTQHLPCASQRPGRVPAPCGRGVVGPCELFVGLSHLQQLAWTQLSPPRTR